MYGYDLQYDLARQRIDELLHDAEVARQCRMAGAARRAAAADRAANLQQSGWLRGWLAIARLLRTADKSTGYTAGISPRTP